MLPDIAETVDDARADEQQVTPVELRPEFDIIERLNELAAWKAQGQGAAALNQPVTFCGGLAQRPAGESKGLVPKLPRAWQHIKTGACAAVSVAGGEVAKIYLREPVASSSIRPALLVQQP